MSPRDWRHHVGDMIEAIRKIQEYSAGLSLEDFENDSKTLDAIVRNLITLGEAARRIPIEVAGRYPSVAWRAIADLRNFAVHEYWGVDAGTIWDTIRVDLAPLASELKMILDDSRAGEQPTTD